MTADLSVTVGDITLKAPIMPASGTFGLGYGRVFDLNRLGALVPKTITLSPREGHPPPRLTEEAGGLMNAIGIPSVGVEKAISDVFPPYKAFAPPLVVSISGDTVEEFGALAARLDGVADALEVNLSCPNLEAGGQAFALDPAATRNAVAACRSATRLPLWCKLAPHAGRPQEVAKAAEDAGADALILANTLLAFAVDEAGKPRLANRTGGLSGRPVKPVALRLVDEAAQAVAIPLIGCGGVFTLRDVLDYFSAGASAVAVGTATFHRATTMVDLIDALACHCTAKGIAAADLVARRPS